MQILIQEMIPLEGDDEDRPVNIMARGQWLRATDKVVTSNMAVTELVEMKSEQSNSSTPVTPGAATDSAETADEPAPRKSLASLASQMKAVAKKVDNADDQSTSYA